jgi:signal transduction histidine kinase
LAGPHDEEWFELRERIGRRHVKIGLPQRFMLTAMNVMRSEVHRLVDEKIDAPQQVGMLSSFDRLFDMELAIMLETYKEDSENRLRSAERLAAIGQLAATIGHDLRNPMGVIKSSSFILRRRAGDDERAVRHLDRIDRQLGVAGEIIEDLLHFVRDAPLSPRRITAFDVLQQAASEWREEHPVPIDCDVSLDLDVDVALIRRALVNMLENARQASRNGDDLAGVEMRGHQKGDWIHLEVLDRGEGFDQQTLARAFQPLFTTRASGTGLGLALVGRVAERHGGSSHVANREGGGAVVSIVLPSKGG